MTTNNDTPQIFGPGVHDDDAPPENGTRAPQTGPAPMPGSPRPSSIRLRTATPRRAGADPAGEAELDPPSGPDTSATPSISPADDYPVDASYPRQLGYPQDPGYPNHLEYTDDTGYANGAGYPDAG